MVLEWPNPRNTEDDTPPDNMEATLYDEDGVPIGGQAWPAQMLPDANNDWRTTLSPDLDVARCDTMRAEVVATDIQGGKGTIFARVAVRDRER